MPTETVGSFIRKQEFLLAAEDLKKEKSLDYCKGFDDGAKWLIDHNNEMMKALTNEELIT